MKKRVYIFRVRFGRERKASRLPCLSFGLGNDRRCTSGNGDVSLAIFITFVNGSKSLASFTNRFFHFSGTPGFKMAFMRPKEMEDLAAIGAREVKRVAAEERKREKNSSAKGQ